MLDQFGHVRETFTGGGINGPWDMASLDLGNQAVLFVTNVLNGTVAADGNTVFGGTVLRLVIKIPRFGLPFIWFDATIGSGFPETLNSAALVIGPTGVGLGRERHAVRRRHAGQPDRRHPGRALPRLQRRHRLHRLPGPRAERPARPGHRAQR